MKFSVDSTARGLVVIACRLALVSLLLIAVPIAQAAQAVLNPKADPNSVFVGQPTRVTFTAVVPSDPNLIVGSVNLVRYDAGQQVVGVIGTLYDDGTHGDAHAGDGTYTAQLTLDETSPTLIYYRVSVAYKGTLKRTLSSFIAVNAVTCSPGSSYAFPTGPTYRTQYGSATLSRTIPWAPGIPGGVPQRTTVCATLSPTGNGDDAAITHQSPI
jgi:hypothetical protein